MMSRGGECRFLLTSSNVRIAARCPSLISVSPVRGETIAKEGMGCACEERSYRHADTPLHARATHIPVFEFPLFN